MTKELLQPLEPCVDNSAPNIHLQAVNLLELICVDNRLHITQQKKNRPAGLETTSQAHGSR